MNGVESLDISPSILPKNKGSKHALAEYSPNIIGIKRAIGSISESISSENIEPHIIPIPTMLHTAKTIKANMHSLDKNLHMFVDLAKFKFLLSRESFNFPVFSFMPFWQYFAKRKDTTITRGESVFLLRYLFRCVLESYGKANVTISNGQTDRNRSLTIEQHIQHLLSCN